MSSARSTVPVVAVIPARGGSKGVPRKNLAQVGGVSLVGRAVRSAVTAQEIDLVVVSTDDDEIAAEGRRHGARVVDRPAELSSDESSSESALLHAVEVLEAEGLRPDVLVFLQCTSPFIDPAALDRAVRRVLAGTADSVLAAAPTYEFLWQRGAGGATGLNHDQSVRLRRQDREPDWRETGAFYVMSTQGFVAARHRFFGRVEVEAVEPRDAIEVDTPEELEIVRAIAGRAAGSRIELSGIEVLVTDFDGVHTDDRAIVSDDGGEAVTVNRRDGHGVKLLREAGIEVFILSTERNAVVARRAEKLEVECIHGVDDKAAVLAAWLQDRRLDPAVVAYLGNDVNDLGCLELVGLPMCVADAHPAVVEASRIVTTAAGGAGAVREVAEAILASRSG